jgi:membrane associated rhomboid family serine protease
MTVIRSTPARALVDQWALVLSSQRIRSRIARAQDGWSLIVSSDDADRAAGVLGLWERENPKPGPKPPPLPEWGPTRVGLGMAGLLVAFFVVTGPRRPGVSWFERGSATAELILEGEWWRTVTALTLHADLAHIAANAVTGALFATAVCRWVGPGVGGALILLSGILGNALNALARGEDHSSVGASTAIFGAVGLLGGLGLVRGMRLGLRRGQVWAPFAACLGILAMLGTGERTDVWAHLFGFGSGAFLGVLAAPAVRRPPSGITQAALGVLALGVVIGCWMIALA